MNISCAILHHTKHILFWKIKAYSGVQQIRAYSAAKTLKIRWL
jgi:hypothetical protein